MNNLIKKILVEWSYRLDDGIIDLENYKHLSILREVLSDMELSSEIIIEVMGNITEKEGDSKPLSDKDKKKMSDMGLVWKGKGYGKEGEDGCTHGVEDDKLVPYDDKKSSDKTGGSGETPPEKKKVTKIDKNPFTDDTESKQKKDKEYRMFTNIVFDKENDAEDFGKKSMKRGYVYKIVEYNKENYDKYWN